MKDKILIRQIKRGDEKAFEILYNRYFHRVLNYADKILHSREDSKEIAQDVFVKFWDKRCELDPDKSFSGLIFQITKYCSINRVKKRESDIKVLNISSATNVEIRSLESQFLDEELYKVYLEIVNKLPEKRRVIFQLSRERNLSHKEISQNLDISIKTVEAQIRLALRHIREDLKNYSDSLLMILMVFLFW